MQQRLQSVLDEKMKQGAQTLDSKKDAIKELVDRIGHDLEASQKKIEQSEQARISQFSALKSVVDEHKLVTSELKTSTDDLKNILSNNQLRGRYGEEVAENLLLSVGFVKGQQYLANTALDTVTTRPDFTILLPDKTKLNIDAKFPFQSLLKYQAAETKVDKDIYLREFSKDVKQKIKQATSRDYINPAEQTLDFVVMFVPNEMIFSFIYEKMPDIWEDALKQKVILAGPFSFTALLRMVYQAYRNFRYQENLHDIIKLIKTFELEYTKFNEELDTLGTRLQSASDQYQKVSVTRTKKLTSVVEKIKTEEISDATDEVVELIK
jgi:DNA recombination protein RmuC